MANMSDESILSEKLQKKKSLDDFKPFDSGELKNDFVNGDYRGEMLDDRY
ncbi:MAG: hypothetical protein Q4B64_03890 [Spirochaetales bacterium]|nr:hypothetical protein [Spirochaetales bacterium]